MTSEDADEVVEEDDEDEETFEVLLDKLDDETSEERLPALGRRSSSACSASTS